MAVSGCEVISANLWYSDGCSVGSSSPPRKSGADSTERGWAEREQHEMQSRVFTFVCQRPWFGHDTAWFMRTVSRSCCLARQ